MINRSVNSSLVSKKTFNYNEVDNVGILFYLDDENSFKQIDKFVKELKKKHKRVKALGYYSKKEASYNVSISLTYDLYTQKDFSFYYKPKSTVVKDFIEEKFDLLIDLCPIDILENSLIANLSEATYKVGKQKDKLCPYDFMIQDKKNLSITEFITNIKHYILK